MKSINTKKGRVKVYLLITTVRIDYCTSLYLYYFVLLYFSLESLPHCYNYCSSMFRSVRSISCEDLYRMKVDTELMQCSQEECKSSLGHIWPTVTSIYRTKYLFKTCLYGGGGPRDRVCEVTRLHVPVIEN